MKEILHDLSEIVGKEVASSFELEDMLIITFTDNSYVALKSKGGYDGCDPSAPDVAWPETRYDCQVRPLVACGLWTKQDLAEWQRQQDAAAQKAEQDKNEAERAEFERLKAKFEKP